MPKHKNTSVQYVCARVLSRIFLSATPSTAAHLASLTMGFSRQEHQHFLLRGILLTQGSHLHGGCPLHTTPSPPGLFEIMNCPVALQLHGFLSAVHLFFGPATPKQGPNPRPQQWKCRVLTTGPRQKSPSAWFLSPPRFCAFLQDTGHPFSCFSTMPGTVLGSVIA